MNNENGEIRWMVSMVLIQIREREIKTNYRDRNNAFFKTLIE